MRCSKGDNCQGASSCSREQTDPVATINAAVIQDSASVLCETAAADGAQPGMIVRMLFPTAN